MPDGPLAGFKVVEIGSMVAAPFCAKLLGDWGADVVKVEPPTGDPLRGLAPGFFRNLNTSKRGAVLDFDTAGARERLRGLVAQADVVVEDLAPGRLAELVGDPWELRPSVVVASITPFGQTGPRSDWLGGDLVGWAAGGMAYVTGEADGPPLLVPHQASHLAALQTFTGITFALFHALRTGEGQRVDTSIEESVATIVEGAVTDLQWKGTVRGRMGTMHPAAHGVGMQRLADDKWLFVSTLPRPDHWTRTRELMGSPEWMMDPRWDDLGERRRHAEYLDRKASEVFSKWRVEDIFEPMLARGIPVGVVNTMEDVANSEQLRERGYLVEVDGILHPGPPWRMSRTPWSVRPAPELGEHTDEVFS